MITEAYHFARKKEVKIPYTERESSFFLLNDRNEGQTPAQWTLAASTTMLGPLDRGLDVPGNMSPCLDA